MYNFQFIRRKITLIIIVQNKQNKYLKIRFLFANEKIYNFSYLVLRQLADKNLKIFIISIYNKYLCSAFSVIQVK